MDRGKHGDLWEFNYQVVSLFVHDYNIIYVALLKKKYIRGKYENL